MRGSWRIWVGKGLAVGPQFPTLFISLFLRVMTWKKLKTNVLMHTGARFCPLFPLAFFQLYPIDLPRFPYYCVFRLFLEYCVPTALSGLQASLHILTLLDLLGCSEGVHYSQPFNSVLCQWLLYDISSLGLSRNQLKLFDFMFQGQVLSMKILF